MPELTTNVIIKDVMHDSTSFEPAPHLTGQSGHYFRRALAEHLLSKGHGNIK